MKQRITESQLREMILESIKNNINEWAVRLNESRRVCDLPQGRHKFSGIESFRHEDPRGFYDDSTGFYVIIDNTVYAFQYNPDDGYRSYSSIYIPDNKTKESIRNTFPPQDVIITLEHKDENYEEYDAGSDYWHIVDAKTKKEILLVGNHYDYDHYPSAILRYYPENMAINAQISRMNLENYRLFNGTKEEAKKILFDAFYSDVEQYEVDELLRVIDCAFVVIEDNPDEKFVRDTIGFVGRLEKVLQERGIEPRELFKYGIER